MSHISKVVAARVKNETADRVVAISEEDKVTKSEVIERAIKVYDSMRMMCAWGDLEAEELCEQIEEMFREGAFEIIEGKVVTNG